MEIASAKWLSELEMEEYNSIINQSHLMSSDLDHYFDDFNLDNCFSNSESNSTYPNDQDLTPINKPMSSSGANIVSSPQTEIIIINERPSKQLKSNSWESCATNNSIISANKANSSSRSSSSQLISFEKSNSSPPVVTSHQQHHSTAKLPKNEMGYNVNGTSNFTSDQMNASRGVKRVAPTNRSILNAQDHVIAERKRREKLSQKFIALSAVLPGLKKMDKASVLGDAINYVKQLQERVKVLEEQTEKKTIESVVYVKRSQVYVDDEISSSDENFENSSDQPLPEIEARVSERDVLIRIHCENKHKGCLATILNQVEKLNLTILNSSALPFGNSTLDITIVAQMDSDFCMKVKDLVRSLREAMLKFV